MDENGNNTGGIVGFFKSVGYAIKTLSPTRCIIVFDGVGGSFKRRQIFPQYKERRKGHIRLNRTYEDMPSGTSEEENCQRQYIKLLRYLQVLPVNLLSIDHVEADDVIAFLAVEQFKNSRKVFIMSSDKDFLQLCNNNISVYSPTKKRIYGPKEVISEYQIHPNNFALYRAMDGDTSDNINGIEGAGPKTIIKHFPWLSEEKVHTVDELVTAATDLRNKYKVCDRISEGKLLLERNVALMQLRETALTTAAQLHCAERMDTKNIPLMNRNIFLKMATEDSMENGFPHIDQWVNTVFDPMNSVIREE
jgi:5'-3' exonuclease